MVALNFKPEFVFAIDGGSKRRTIRRVRKTGNPEPGKPLQLYTGMRTLSCDDGTYIWCLPGKGCKSEAEDKRKAKLKSIASRRPQSETP